MTKRAVLAGLPLGERRDLVPGFVALTNVHNEHGAMGWFGNSAPLLIALSLVVAIVLAVALHATIVRSALAQIGFGAMLGGAAGNVIDRSSHGYVVDFIALRSLSVFNVADACITLGLGALALAAMRER